MYDLIFKKVTDKICLASLSLFVVPFGITFIWQFVFLLLEKLNKWKGYILYFFNKECIVYITLSFNNILLLKNNHKYSWILIFHQWNRYFRLLKKAFKKKSPGYEDNGKLILKTNWSEQTRIYLYRHLWSPTLNFDSVLKRNLYFNLTLVLRWLEYVSFLYSFLFLKSCTTMDKTNAPGSSFKTYLLISKLIILCSSTFY